jgi:hypothetical protein
VLAESGMMILPGVFCEHGEIAEMLQSRPDRTFHEVKVEQSARARLHHDDAESDTSEIIPDSQFSIQWFEHAKHPALSTVADISFRVPVHHIAQVASSNLAEQADTPAP